MRPPSIARRAQVGSDDIRMGLDFRRVAFGDPAAEIERVNDWLSGRGAWRLASADYWHARRVLESVVGRSL